MEFDNLKDLLNYLSPYISARALARICKISESEMLQYSAGLRDFPESKKALINEGLSHFASNLSNLKLK